MNWKTSRNEKHKYFNEEKLALGENQNTSTLMNIAQEDDGNIFELLKKLVTKQSSIYHLKMFYILFLCSFCFYFTFTVYTNVLNTAVFMARKGKKKTI